MEILLFAWSEDADEWVAVQCDEDGNLLIDLANIDLGDLGDVDAESPGDGEFLVFDLASGTWKARALADGDIPAGIARDAEVVALIAAHAGVSDAHHTRYADAEAVSAMGAKADSNPLHHDRYTDAEADARIAAGQVGARVYHNETQTVPNNSETYPSFNSERWDTDTIHDTVTNNERLTCKTAGKYLVVIQLVLAIQGDGVGIITVYKNGLETPLFQDGKAAQAVLEGVIFADSFVADLSVDDYIYIGVFQETGDDAFLVYTEGTWPEFTMQRIG
jgi:hypothetical protein